MKPWVPLWLAIAVLAQGTRAAEVTLTITPPEPDWLLPPASAPCPLGGGFRLEACTRQLIPEGIAERGEEALVFDLTPLLAAGNYEAVLSRARLNYGTDLDLLEAGDFEGFLATRRPSNGFTAGVPFVPPQAQFERARRSVNAPAIDDGEVRTRDLRPPPNASGNALAGRREVSPDYISASMLYVIGHAYFSLDRHLAAETAFRLALVAFPNHIRAHESLGMLYLQTQRYDEARAYLADAVELGRNTAHVHAALGYLGLKTRHYVAAASAFQKALVLAPTDRSAQRGLLHALTETREHAKARALVEQLLAKEPDDLSLWRYRARITLAANDRAAALASLETALRLGDDSPDNRRACITLHLENGNSARAVELLRSASPRDLDFALLDRALGWLASANEWEYFRELSASVDRTALGGVEQSRLLTRRAALALRDGNRRAASAALQEALELDPSNAEALMALGEIYRAERDYGRADLLLRRAGDYSAVRDAALVARAEVAIDQENYDGALALLRNIVGANPARADLERNIVSLQNLVVLRTQR